MSVQKKKKINGTQRKNMREKDKKKKAIRQKTIKWQY